MLIHILGYAVDSNTTVMQSVYLLELKCVYLISKQTDLFLQLLVLLLRI